MNEAYLDGIHVLRTQPEVMIYTVAGRIDADKEVTREFMSRFLPPYDSQSYGTIICLASTDEVIGTGGVRVIDPNSGWPEIGYTFKTEHWGKGYATEWMKGWLSNWWTLPRSEVEMEVDAGSVDGPGESPEKIWAVVEGGNIGSKRVLEKLGFRKFKQWTEPDNREGFPDKLTLVGYVLSHES